MTRIVLPNVGDLTAFGRDRGTGTALPETDLRRGDVYLHTALGLLVYTGAAWRQAARLNTVYASLATLATDYGPLLYDGFEVWLTDLDTRAAWTGTAFWPERTAPVTVTFTPTFQAFPGWRALHYWRNQRTVFLSGMLQVATGQSVASGAEIVATTLPVGFRPPVDIMGKALVSSTGLCRIDISASGTVEVVASNGLLPAATFLTVSESWALD